VAKLQQGFSEWQEALECKGLKVNADKTETVVRGLMVRTLDLLWCVA